MTTRRRRKDPTLAEVLAELGLTYQHDGPNMPTRILRDGAEVFRGRAGDVWAWLRAQGLHTLAMMRLDAKQIDRRIKARRAQLAQIDRVAGPRSAGGE